jgi:uncharacterized protein YjbI with pentapeptide repeats
MNLQNYSNQNLQDQSFVGLDLTEADFSGSDLRGCDFTKAILVGTNFERIVTGQTQKQINTSILTVIMGAIAMIAFSLVIVGIDSILFGWFGASYRKISGFLASIIPFVLLMLQSLIFEKFPKITNFFGDASLGILLAMMTVLTLGFTFISFTGAFFFLIPMIISAIITFYLYKWMLESIQNRTGTSFKKANLTDANFSHALIEYTDFSFALLTGIFIDGWLIDGHTLFANSQCDYLYWKPQRERYPNDGNFQTNELENFLRKFQKN